MYRRAASLRDRVNNVDQLRRDIPQTLGFNPMPGRSAMVGVMGGQPQNPNIIIDQILNMAKGLNRDAGIMPNHEQPIPGRTWQQNIWPQQNQEPEEVALQFPDDQPPDTNLLRDVVSGMKHKRAAGVNPAIEQEQESLFQNWYAGWAGRLGLSPDPDDPEHKYDYRSAFKANAEPVQSPHDGLFHWPTQFRAPDHPDRFIDDGTGRIIDTATGLPAATPNRPTPERAAGTPLSGIQGVGENLTPEQQYIQSLKEKTSLIPNVPDINQQTNDEFVKWVTLVPLSLGGGTGGVSQSLANTLRMLYKGSAHLCDFIFGTKSFTDPEKNWLLKGMDDYLDASEKQLEQDFGKPLQEMDMNQAQQFISMGLEAVPQVATAAFMSYALTPAAFGAAATGGTLTPATTTTLGKFAETYPNIVRMLPFGAQAFGGAAREAEHEGATFTQQVLTGVFVATGEMATESIPFERALGIIRKLGVDSLVEQGSKGLMKRYGSVGLEYLRTMLEEAVEEAVMEPWTGLVKKSIYQPEKPWKGEGGVIDPDAIKDAFVGGLAMSVVLGAIGLPATVSSHNRAAQAIREHESGMKLINDLATTMAEDLQLVDDVISLEGQNVSVEQADGAKKAALGEMEQGDQVEVDDLGAYTVYGVMYDQGYIILKKAEGEIAMVSFGDILKVEGNKIILTENTEAILPGEREVKAPDQETLGQGEQIQPEEAQLDPGVALKGFDVSTPDGIKAALQDILGAFDSIEDAIAYAERNFQLKPSAQEAMPEPGQSEPPAFKTTTQGVQITPEMVRAALGLAQKNPDLSPVKVPKEWKPKAQPKPPAGQPAPGPEGQQQPAPQPEGGQTDGALEAYGLKIERTTTKRGNPVWEVSGKTYQNQGALKAAGGSYFGQKKVYSFYQEADPTDAILAELKKRGSEDGESTGRTDGQTGQGSQGEQKPRDRRRVTGLDTRISLTEPEEGRYGSLVLTRGKGPAEGVGPGFNQKISKILRPHQADGANMAIAAIDAYGGFILADGTGAGKTMEELVVANHYVEQGNTALIVVPNRQIIDTRFKPDAEMLGVKLHHISGQEVVKGAVNVITYKSLDNISEAQIDYIVFDEGHYLKNYTSNRARVGMHLSEKSKGVMFASATPLDKGEHIRYLHKLGIFEHYSFDEMMESLGYRLGQAKDKKGTVKDVWRPSVALNEIADRLDDFFEELGDLGLIVKREVSMENMSVGFWTVELDNEAFDSMIQIEEVYCRRYHVESPDQLVGLQKAGMLMAQRRFQEHYKVAAVQEMAENEVKAGRQVVIFATRTNPSDLKEPIYMEIGGERVKVDEIIHDTSPPTLPDLAEYFESKGMTVAKIYGQGNVAGAVERFQSGEAQIALVTPEKGGAGLSLDDTVGDKPRTMIVVTPLFSGIDNVQVAGRINRLTTKSNGRVVYVMANTEVDDWNRRIIVEKMTTLKAAVAGDIAKLDLDAMDADSGEASETVTTQKIRITGKEKWEYKITDTHVEFYRDGKLVGTNALENGRPGMANFGTEDYNDFATDADHNKNNQKMFDLLHKAGEEIWQKNETERRELQRAVFVDDLTGLQNQRSFLKAKEVVDKDADRAWVFIDLRNFHPFNRINGNEAGDAKLKEIGELLHKEYGDAAFRPGGDEFAIAVRADQAQAAAEKIRELLPDEKIGDSEYLFGADVGYGSTFAEANKMSTELKAARKDVSARPVDARNKIPDDAPDELKNIIQAANDNPHLDDVEYEYRAEEMTRFWSRKELDEIGYTDHEEGEYRITGYHESLLSGQAGRVVFGIGASKDTYVEETVHHLQRKLQEIDPELARDIEQWEDTVRQRAAEQGIDIPQGEETFAQAYTFSEMGYADQAPEVAELFAVPEDIVERFNKILGASRTGKNDIDLWKGTSKPKTPKGLRKLARNRTDLPKLSEGNSTTTYTDDGKTKIEVRYVLAELDDLATSHRPGDKYPQEIQPRNIDKDTSIMRISQIRGTFVPLMMLDNVLFSKGAPKVLQNGAVIIGNHRVEALRELYETKDAKVAEYIETLQDHAERLGLSKKAIGQAKAPVLVMEIVDADKHDLRKLAETGNVSGEARMTSTEVAAIDAGNLTEEVLNLFVPHEEGIIDTVQNSKFISKFMGQVVPASERGQLMKDQRLNQDGINRIRNAVIYKAYGEEVASHITEDTDDNVRNISRAMINAAPKLVVLKEAASKGERFPLDITEDIAMAMIKYSALRDQNMSVEKYLDADQLVTDELRERVVARAVLSLFDKHKRSSKKITHILLEYVNMADLAGNPKQQSLFTNNAPAKIDVLDAARQKVEQEMAKDVKPEDAGQGSIFQVKKVGREGTLEAGPAAERAAAKERDALRNPNTIQYQLKMESETMSQEPAGKDFKPPEKTIKAYKLFQTKPSRPGEIFPLFIDAKTPTPTGVWIPAKFVKVGEGKTSEFADRPGWHAGPLPDTPHLNMYKTQGGKKIPRVWAEVELSADRDWQSVADKSPTEDIRDQVPEGGYYLWKRPEAQGGNWYIAGALKVNRILTEQEVKQIVKDAKTENKQSVSYQLKALNTYYYKSEVVAQNLPARKPADQILQQMKKEVKGDELKWLGLEHFLEDKGSELVRKEEVLERIENGKLIIEELVLSEATVSAQQASLNEASTIYNRAHTKLYEVVRDAYEEDNTLGGYYEKESSGYLSALDVANGIVNGLDDADPARLAKLPKAVRKAVKEYRTRRAKLQEVKAQPREKHPHHRKWASPGGFDYTEIAIKFPWSEVIHSAQEHVFERELARAGATKEQIELIQDEWGTPKAEKLAREIAPLAFERYERDYRRYADMPYTPPDIHELPKNTLGHIRLQTYYDDAGRMILFIDEIQSDWAAEARAKVNRLRYDEVLRFRFLKDYFEGAEMEKVFLDADQSLKVTVNTALQGLEPGIKWPNKGDAEKFADYIALYERVTDYQITPTPFKDTWHELLLKRVVRLAADNGFDAVAWTRGEQQADRYNLRKVVSRITWRPQTNQLDAYDHGDRSVYSKKLKSEKELEAHIGRAAAQKLLESPAEVKVVESGDGAEVFIDDEMMASFYEVDQAEKYANSLRESNQLYVLRGQGLDVGGQGLASIYDKLIPTYLKKYLKQWGAELTEMELPIPLKNSKREYTYNGPDLGVREVRAKISAQRKVRDALKVKIANLDHEAPDYDLAVEQRIRMDELIETLEFVESVMFSDGLSLAEAIEARSAYDDYGAKRVAQSMGGTLDRHGAKSQMQPGFIVKPEMKTDYPLFQLKPAGSLSNTLKQGEKLLGRTSEANRELQKMAKKKAAGKQEIASREQINRLIQKYFHVPIRLKHISERSAAGIYKPKFKMRADYGDVESIRLRTRWARDLKKTTHELGHHLSKIIGFKAADYKDELLNIPYVKGLEGRRDYPEDRRIEEGVAEFMKYYLVEPGEAEQRCPQFYDHFEDRISAHPDLQDKLLHVRAVIHAYHKQGSKARVGSFIQEPPKKGWFNLNRLYDGLVDELAPVQRYLNYFMGKGQELASELDPYKKMRLAKSYFARAHYYLAYGQDRFNKDGTKVISEGKSLRDIMAPIQELGEDHVTDWVLYMVSQRALEIERMVNKETGKRMVSGLDPVDAQAYIEEIMQSPHYELYERQAQEVYKFNHFVLKQLVGHSISAEMYDQIVTEHAHYIPFQRVRSDLMQGGNIKLSKYANRGRGIYKLSGADLPIRNPIESIVRQTHSITALAMQNDSMLTFVDTAKVFNSDGKGGTGLFFDNIPAPLVPFTVGETDVLKILLESGVDITDPDLDLRIKSQKLFKPQGEGNEYDNIVTVWRDGKQEYYEFHDMDLMRAILHMDTEQSGAIAKIGRSFANVMRLAHTVNFRFILYNPARDQFAAMAYSKHGYNGWLDFMKGFTESVGQGENFKEWMLAGGPMSSFDTFDKNYLQKSLKYFTKKKWYDMAAPGEVDGHALNPLSYMRYMATLSEYSTNLGEYMKAKKAGKNWIDASMAGKDITVDHLRHGSKTGLARDFIPFFNATIQGHDKMIREVAKHPGRTFLRFFMFITLPTLALYFLNRDNEYYWELPDWRRDVFWNIPVGDPKTTKLFIPYPKPFLPGLLFGAMAERFMNYVDRKDKDAFDKWGESIIDMAAPNTTIWPIELAYEWSANKNFYTGMPIVPMREFYLPEDMQYGPHTSEVAKLAGKVTQQSPRKIDHSLSKVTGLLGKPAIQGMDALLRAAGVGDHTVRPEPTIDEMPIIGDFLTKARATGASTLDQFYEDLSDAEKAYSKASEETGLPSNELYYMAANGLLPAGLLDQKQQRLLAALPLIRKLQRDLSEIRKIERLLYKANTWGDMAEFMPYWATPEENLTPQMKREAIDYLQLQQINLARLIYGLPPVEG